MIWDELHLKALLRLPRYPKKLLDDEPWASWLRERGGTNAVRESLRKAPPKPVEGQLLEMILSDPSTPPFRRAAVLHVSQSTYFRYLDVLVAMLVEYLNGQGDMLSTNLPVPLTPLIGAETTLQRILTLLASSHVRLITLMGTGGIGKTRLATQAARHMLEGAAYRQLFADGIFWVDLAPLHTSDLILVEIARVLNLTERSGYPTLELLQHELNKRQVLLLLDNFEHLLAAAPLVAALLQETTHLKILVTSRAALNISGEHRFSIPPLGLPELDPLPAFEHLTDYGAIQFFVQRAQMINHAFTLTPENAIAVAQFCAALDGLPLALEMAAKRISYLSPQKMLTMPGQRLLLLTGGASDVAPRHQTLRNLIDWSHQLLEADQQVAFRFLAVFANGWTLEAMEAVCQVSFATPVFDILGALIDHSIVFQVSSDSAPRFGLLEIIREYAQEKLTASGEEAIIRQRHAVYYLSLVEAWARAYHEPSLPIVQVEHEYHNLRNALQWAVEQGQSELALDLGLALWHYWSTSGSPNEGQYWLERVLAIRPVLRSPKRVHVLIVMGYVMIYQNDFQQALAYYDEMLALAREFHNNDDLGIALQGLGDIAHFTGDYPRANRLYLQSLALYRGMNKALGVSWTLDRLGNTAFEQGFLAEALAYYSESLEIFEAQAYLGGIAHARAKLGLIAFEEGRYAEAVAQLEDSLASLRSMNPTWHYAWIFDYLGQAVLGLGDLPRAADFFRQSLKMHFEGKAYRVVAYSLHGLANVALAAGEPQRAVRLLSAVQMVYEQHAPVPSRRRQLELSITRSRDALDPAAFDIAWREGHSIPLAQIVAEELDASR